MKLLMHIVLGLVVSGSCIADTPVVYEDYALLASDGMIGDSFGYSVAVDGQTMVVGANLEDHDDNDENHSGAGSAYIYRFNGNQWIEETKLTASDAANGDGFGYSVAISGDYIVVGAANYYGKGIGAVYLYHFNGAWWDEEIKLTASDGALGDRFGRSVSISGHTVIVGADGDDDNGDNSGSTYIYQFDGSNWVETKLRGGSQYDMFGKGVAITGNTIIVGAIGDDENNTNSGSAYIYRLNGKQWNEDFKLLPSDAPSNASFGYSVAIDGDTVVVGARHDNDPCSSSGSAYIYQFDGFNWIETKISPSDCDLGDAFGISVAVDGGTVVVGAFGDDGGTAYIYRFNGKQWNEDFKLRASQGNCGCGLGISVAVNDNIVATGANGNYDDTGTAYIFHDTDGDGFPDSIDNCYLYNPDQVDCNENGIGDICDVADSTSFDCDQNNVPDECQSDCDGDGFIDACDNDADVDGDGIPDNCEPDCNGNTIPDDFEIKLGLAQDCNGNGIPDECDIADGTGVDCNENGILDGCELEDPANDQNNNGILDECECIGDINVDGIVNISDLLFILGYWGNNTPEADLNFDGIVNVTDLLIVISNWGSCE